MNTFMASRRFISEQLIALEIYLLLTDEKPWTFKNVFSERRITKRFKIFFPDIRMSWLISILFRAEKGLVSFRIFSSVKWIAKQPPNFCPLETKDLGILRLFFFNY